MVHNHDHSSGNLNRAFAIGTVLNLIFVVIEAGYGAMSHSLALLADAGHNLSDVMMLLLGSDGSGKSLGYSQTHLWF